MRISNIPIPLCWIRSAITTSFAGIMVKHDEVMKEVAITNQSQKKAGTIEKQLVVNQVFPIEGQQISRAAAMLATLRTLSSMIMRRDRRFTMTL
jgi:hypothetical protein